MFNSRRNYLNYHLFPVYCELKLIYELWHHGIDDYSISVRSLDFFSVIYALITSQLINAVLSAKRGQFLLETK